MPLKDVFDQPETMWIQFRRRLDRVRPYCRIASHTEAQVRNVLLALERIYHPSFAQGEKDVSSKHLQVAAESLTLRRDAIHLIDAGEGNEENKDWNEGPSSEPNPK